MENAPIVDAAIALLQEGKPGEEPVQLPKSAEKQLKERLQQHVGTPELGPSIAHLCVFAVWLGDEEKSPAARDLLLRVAESGLAALDKQERGLAESVRTASADHDFSKLTGYVKQHYAEATDGGVTGGVLAQAKLKK